MFKGNFMAKLGINLVFDLLLVLLVISFVRSGSVGLGSFIEALGYLFGGVPSLLDLLLLAIVVAGFVGVYFLARLDLNALATGLAVILAVLAALYGFDWIDLPTGSAWALFGLLVFTFLRTLAIVPTDASLPVVGRRTTPTRATT